ncbi:MAG: type III pantothenate kinase [Alphaproteobacteria bacterium]|nr:type III pantothenate kinase [Alphaproteobacteria bacterium]
MLLAINANNTNTSFCVFDGDQVRGTWRTRTEARRTGDEFAAWLSQIMALSGLKLADIDAVIIAIVVPEMMFNLKTLCRKYFRCEPMVIGEPGVDLGIKVLIDKPEEAGADRLVNAVEAHATYGGPLVVVDYGTATNFDLVDAQGNFVGGIIATGINLSLKALYEAAAKLPHIAVRRPARVIGKGTGSAQESGIFWGYIGLVEGLIQRIEKEFGAKMKVIATGGLAPLFEGAIHFDAVDVDLTVRGLLRVYRRNRKP